MNSVIDAPVIFGATVIHARGDLTARDMVRMANCIQDYLELGHSNLVIDFSLVESIVPYGIGFLLPKKNLAASLGGELVLAGVHSHVKRSFQLVGLEQHFRTYLSVEDAIQSFDCDWGYEKGVVH